MTKKLDIPKKEIYAQRVDPQLKYLAEIAARSQRRSLANFVEWAIAQSLHDVPVSNEPGAPSVARMGGKLWDIDRAKRLEFKGRKPTLDPERRAELCRKAAEGVPRAKLARDYGISRETVYQYIRCSKPDLNC